MNKVILTGRLTHSPEHRTTNAGTSVVSFSLAVRRTFKNANGEYDTDFINCVAWRQAAEMIEKHFNKGDGITVFGEIRTRSYTDNDGNNRNVVEVLVNEFEFPITRKAASEPASEPANNNVKDSSGEVQEVTSINEDDDLPF